MKINLTRLLAFTYITLTIFACEDKLSTDQVDMTLAMDDRSVTTEDMVAIPDRAVVTDLEPNQDMASIDPDQSLPEAMPVTDAMP